MSEPESLELEEKESDKESVESVKYAFESVFCTDHLWSVSELLLDGVSSVSGILFTPEKIAFLASSVGFDTNVSYSSYVVCRLCALAYQCQ